MLKRVQEWKSEIKKVECRDLKSRIEEGWKGSGRAKGRRLNGRKAVGKENGRGREGKVQEGRMHEGRG